MARRLLPLILAAFVALVLAPSALGLGLVPVNLLPPTISGSAQQGQVLTCSTGTWLNSPTAYAYTWQRDASNIGGATSSTYTLTSGDVGHVITCTVIASNAGGSSLPATSLPVVPVALPIATIPLMTSPPSVSGTPQQGQALSCSSGTWTNSPTSYAYSWQRNATDISGATSSAYTLTSADVNQLITCTVVATNVSGSSVPAISLPVLPTSVLVPVDVLPPSISGSAQEGQTLTCSTGTWLNSPTGYAYTWQRDASTIGGATNSTYTLTSSDVNHAITCTVVASNADGSSLPAISLPVVPVALPILSIPLMTSLPAISGTAVEGQTLHCSSGSWTNSPTSFAYTWQRDLANIPGATSSDYTLANADVNQLVTCTVISSNASGSSVPAISVPVIPTSPLIPVNLAIPQIFGTPKLGQTLACGPGSWTNSPTGYTYSWQRDLVNMVGATSPTYTVSAADVGHALTCLVYAYNAAGQSLPALSHAVLPIFGLLTSTGTGGTQKLQAPVVSSFSVRPRPLVELIKRHRLRTKGARFRYHLSQAAAVLIVIQRRLRSGRYVKVVQLVVRNNAAGLDSLKWGLRAHGRAVASGRYRAIIAAVNAHGWSNRRSIRFRVVRRR